MLTKKKINIYIKYSGDLDAFTIAGTKKEKAIMGDEDWMLIDDLVQDVELMQKNLISKEMKDRVYEKMKMNLVDEDIEMLIKLVIEKRI